MAVEVRIPTILRKHTGGEKAVSADGDTASGLAWAVTKNRISNDFSTSTRLGGLIAGAG